MQHVTRSVRKFISGAGAVAGTAVLDFRRHCAQGSR